MYADCGSFAVTGRELVISDFCRFHGRVSGFLKTRILMMIEDDNIEYKVKLADTLEGCRVIYSQLLKIE